MLVVSFFSPRSFSIYPIPLILYLSIIIYPCYVHYQKSSPDVIPESPTTPEAPVTDKPSMVIVHWYI